MKMNQKDLYQSNHIKALMRPEFFSMQMLVEQWLCETGGVLQYSFYDQLSKEDHS